MLGRPCPAPQSVVQAEDGVAALFANATQFVEAPCPFQSEVAGHPDHARYQLCWTPQLLAAVAAGACTVVSVHEGRPNHQATHSTGGPAPPAPHLPGGLLLPRSTASGTQQQARAQTHTARNPAGETATQIPMFPVQRFALELRLAAIGCHVHLLVDAASDARRSGDTIGDGSSGGAAGTGIPGLPPPRAHGPVEGGTRPPFYGLPHHPRITVHSGVLRAADDPFQEPLPAFSLETLAARYAGGRRVPGMAAMRRTRRLLPERFKTPLACGPVGLRMAKSTDSRSAVSRTRRYNVLLVPLG